MRLKRFLFFYIFLIFGIYNAYSQNDCPNFNGTQTSRGFYVNDIYGDSGAYIEGLTESVGNDYKVSIDWSSYDSTYSEYFKSLRWDQKRELLIVSIIGALVNCKNSSISKIAFYKTVPCVKWDWCYLNAKETGTIYCKTPGYGADPQLFNYNGNNYVMIGQKTECGEKCCEKIYHVECQLYATNKYKPVITYYRTKYLY